MKFNFTQSQLQKIIPRNQEVQQWHEALTNVLPKYNINTALRVASFVSQCAHESYDFTILEENLNYSKNALETVFSRYFGNPPKRDADEYARNPKKIANYVYMDEYRRYKMGNIYPGDGWRFRGKGLKQVTGRDNVTQFAKSIGITAEQASEYLLTKEGALKSACWYWDTHSLNEVADTGNVIRLTKKINGGTNGLKDRVERFEHAMQVLGQSVTPTNFIDEVDYEYEVDDMGLLRKGSQGSGVRILQKNLGIAVDGIFGSHTEAVLKDWQRRNQLLVDGIAGPNTLNSMLG